jgi:hypothetical protein
MQINNMITMWAVAENKRSSADIVPYMVKFLSSILWQIYFTLTHNETFGHPESNGRINCRHKMHVLH